MYHPIQVAYPAWYTPFDYAPADAVTSKHRLLDTVAAEGWLVQAYHLAFPGLGHIVREADAYHWQPLQACG
jgi:hypothetical protein